MTMNLGSGPHHGPGVSSDQHSRSELIPAWRQRFAWLCGFNFLPSSAVNSTAMWQDGDFDPSIIDRELCWAGSIGFNSCRVFLPYAVWQHHPREFCMRFDQVLDIAQSYGLSVMPILFDDCAFAGRLPSLGPQPEPVPGVHNSCWTASPGRDLVLDRSRRQELGRYVGDVMGSFAKDARIVCWDLYNEPGNDGLVASSQPLLEDVFAWAASTRPSQPVTVGPWNWEPGFTAINQCMLDRSDVVSFHIYDHLEATARRVGSLPQDRPLICTEWMARTRGSRYDTHLPWFRERDIGCYAWGLIRGRTQTHMPWGSRPGDPDPEVWFHDLASAGGIPHIPGEIDVIREATARARAGRVAQHRPHGPMADSANDESHI